MHTFLASERSTDRDVQPVLTETASALAHRLSPVDRLSLRLGLWLLLRSTRRLARPHDADAHSRARAAHVARTARDASSFEHLMRAHRA